MATTVKATDWRALDATCSVNKPSTWPPVFPLAHTRAVQTHTLASHASRCVQVRVCVKKVASAAAVLKQIMSFIIAGFSGSTNTKISQSTLCSPCAALLFALRWFRFCSVLRPVYGYFGIHLAHTHTHTYRHTHRQTHYEKWASCGAQTKQQRICYPPPLTHPLLPCLHGLFMPKITHAHTLAPKQQEQQQQHKQHPHIDFVWCLGQAHNAYRTRSRPEHPPPSNRRQAAQPHHRSMPPLPLAFTLCCRRRVYFKYLKRVNVPNTHALAWPKHRVCRAKRIETVYY